MSKETKRRLMECAVRANKDGSLTFTASTDKVARDGDIIEKGAWDLKQFRKNPVFLWSHNYEMPPIGRVLDVRADKDLEIDVEFAGLEQMHEHAEMVSLLYRDGFLKAVSVGFIPKAYREVADEERETLGLGRYGRVISEAELLEVSAVSVPADPGALLSNGISAKQKEALACVRSIAREEDKEALAKLQDADLPEPETDSDAVTLETVQESVKELAAEVTALRRAVQRAVKPRKARKTRKRANLPPEIEDDLDDEWGIGKAIDKRKAKTDEDDLA